MSSPQSVLGAVLVPSFLSFLSMGIVLSQATVYFTRFPNDRIGFKLLAGGCLVVCLLDTCFAGSWSYKYMVTHYGDFDELSLVPIETTIIVICLSLTTAMVQGFYAWRIWLLSKRQLILPSIIILCTLVQFGSVIYVGWYMHAHKTWAAMLTGVYPLAWFWLGGSLLGDMTVTFSMIWYLWIKTRNSPAASRGTIFQQILFQTIQSNVINLVAETILMALFHTASLGLWCFVPGLSLTKTTTFSLLASLNARESSTANIDEYNANSGAKTNIALKRTNRGALGDISVHVHESVHVSDDKNLRPWESTRQPVNVHLSSDADERNSENKDIV